MRVLSFVPAFLLAAASFVSAAPAPSPADTSCVSGPSGGSGSDVALQPIINIILNTTAALQPLSQQLTGLQDAGCAADDFSSVVVQITAVVTTGVDQLKAAATVDLTGLYLGDLVTASCDLLGAVLGILNVVVVIIGVLGASALATIKDVVCDLLNIITTLVSCLQVYVVGSIAATLSPVIAVATSLVDLALCIVVGVHVSV